MNEPISCTNIFQVKSSDVGLIQRSLEAALACEGLVVSKEHPAVAAAIDSLSYLEQVCCVFTHFRSFIWV